MLGCGGRPGLQRRAVSSHPLPAPCPKVLPFFLQTPKIQALKACGASRGIQSRVWEGGAPLPSPILGIPSSPHFFPDCPPSLARLPSPRSRFPSSRFPVSFLPSSPFLFRHPSRLHCLATPPASPLSDHPLHPFPSAPEPPTPPALQTEESKLSRIYLFRTRVIIFFPPSSGRKVGKHSPWAPVTCSEAYRCCVPERTGEERGGMPPSVFPRLSPQGWLSQADAPMPRERGSEAGGEGTWEGGGRAAAPPSQSSPRQGDQRK